MPPTVEARVLTTGLPGKISHCCLNNILKKIQVRLNILCSFVLFILFLIGRQLLYSILSVSAIHQHESAAGIYMSPPS